MTPISVNAHLEILVELFVRKDKRERIRALAAKASRRADLVHDLLHDRRSLDAAVLTPLPEGATARSVALALRGRGGGDRAYCVCDLVEVDDRELPLDEALERIVGRERDSLVFPIGSRVAYYENHEGERYLLLRKP